MNLFILSFSLIAKPTLERIFEDPIQIATDGIYLLLVWPSVSGRDVFVSVVGEFLQFRVTLSALRYVDNLSISCPSNFVFVISCIHFNSIARMSPAIS